MIIEKQLVNAVLSIKKTLSIKTYVIESTFVLSTLILTALLAGQKWQEWIAVFAVYFTFKHASVSNRMEEQQALRKSNGERVTVECYQKSTVFFYYKELLWFAYFALTNSYSALAGVIVFLMYGWWRKTYRKYNPIS